MSQYHEAFWVAVAAAAPVLVLSTAVLYGQGTRVWLRGRRERDKIMHAMGLVGLAATVAATTLAMVCIGDAFQALASEKDAVSIGRVEALLVVGYGLVAAAGSFTALAAIDSG